MKYQLIRSVGFLLVSLSVLLSGCGSHVYHQVRKGDTLYSISWRYNQDFRQVAQWNKLRAPYLIHQGQWLRVAPPTTHTRYTTYQDPDKQITQTFQQPPSEPVDQSLLGHAKSYISDRVNEFHQSSQKSLSIDWQWPTNGEVLSKFQKGITGKEGIDIGGRIGDAIYSAADGHVVYSGNGLRGYGNLVIIKHNDAFLSAYAHNQRVVVKEGSVVKKGQVIAYMGDTETTRVKLHFQIRLDGKPINPLRYLPKHSS